MDYGKLCSELLELDSNIRYVGIYNSFSGDVYEKMQGGIHGILIKIKLESP